VLYRWMEGMVMGDCKVVFRWARYYIGTEHSTLSMAFLGTGDTFIAFCSYGNLIWGFLFRESEKTKFESKTDFCFYVAT